MSTAILPGATIGCLGGGQLGRMMAYAARSMGYDVQALDPDPECAIRPVASRVVTARFDDVDAAVALAQSCDVVTLEIEQIHPDVLDAVARHVAMRPGRDAVYVIQDRLRQKRWLSERGFPVGDFVAAASAADISNAVRSFGACIAKATHGGYDGRGQVRLRDASGASDAWAALGSRECIVEKHLDIAFEISVLVARRPGGETAVYPPSRNHHTRGVLTWAVVPAVIDDELSRAAQLLATRIAGTLGIVGLLAVECFVTSEGELLVNELAPRPHNTFHHADRAFATSQFEQLVRAVCDLPLGSTEMVVPGAIVNLLGEVWLQDAPPDIEAALATPTTRIHLYGKASARAGRKMGHLSATGADAAQALGRALECFRVLSPGAAQLFDVQASMTDHLNP